MSKERTPPRLKNKSTEATTRQNKLHRRRELINGALEPVSNASAEEKENRDSSEETVNLAERAAKSTVKELQKKRVQREYAKAVRESTKTTKSAQKAGKKAAEEGKDLIGKSMEKLAETIAEHPVGALVALLIGLAVLLIVYFVNICGAMAGATTGTFSMTYTASDEDLKGVEQHYLELETYLKDEVTWLAGTYTGYDEIVYEFDSMEHDPHMLVSYLTAVFLNFQARNMSGRLEMLLHLQYEASMVSVTETRYTEELKLGYIEKVKKHEPPEEDEIILIPYYYSEFTPYDYKKLVVRIVNRGMEYAVSQSGMNAEQQMRYDYLYSTQGGRPDLFE